MADTSRSVKDVLTSASARKIDFHMGLMHVDAAGLLAIRGLIATELVCVAVIPMSSSDVAAVGRGSLSDG